MSASSPAPPSGSVFRFAAAAQPCGVLVNSPHSGRYYSPQFLASSQLDALALRRSEDAWVDELLLGAPAAGAHFLCALYPRAYVDLNRPPRELDPAMFAEPLPADIVTQSPHIAAGLGTIPRKVSERMEIYAHPLSWREAAERLTRIYDPFHAHMRRRLRQTRAEGGGQALLLDMHSMPSLPHPHDASGIRMSPTAVARPDIVLGNRFGESCHPAIVGRIASFLHAEGYSVSHNRPYAGGYITAQYGRPDGGVHAVQIELNRALYMEEASLTPHAGFAALQASLTRLMRHIAAHWMDWLPAWHPVRAAE